jgi:hypothetical protein
MSLGALIGRALGPAAWPVTAEAVGAFVAATADDAGRWLGFAPPGLAAATLFAVAPALLADPEVARFGPALLHTEQAFSWGRALAVGEELCVRGRVATVRSRGAHHLVTFEMSAVGPAGDWVAGTSTFLLSSAAGTADPGEEDEEPSWEARAERDPVRPCPPLLPGEVMPPMRRAASRADLERYATASGDRNPIHLEHAAARAAGLPGVVTHGLLQAAWLLSAAARHRSGTSPLRVARVRFRRPLRPATPAVVGGRAATDEAGDAVLEVALEDPGGGLPFATATVWVTP